VRGGRGDTGTITGHLQLATGTAPGTQSSDISVSPRAPSNIRKRQICLWKRVSGDGEGQSRTADTAIFSRVLYQLSYLAAGVSLPRAPQRTAT
jgi:hypothetical protein